MTLNRHLNLFQDYTHRVKFRSPAKQNQQRQISTLVDTASSFHALAFECSTTSTSGTQGHHQADDRQQVDLRGGFRDGERDC